MAEPRDVRFIFDPSSFVKGVKIIGRSFVELTSTAAKAAAGVGKKTGRFFKGMFDKFKAAKKRAKEAQQGVQMIGKGIGGFLAKFGLIANGLRAIFGIVRKGLSQIPEIGTTFGIMKTIINRNLLWPLRKELLPLLQSLLLWTQKHRGMFLRWGTVLASVFRAVKTGIMVVISVLKSMFNSFRRTVGGIFADTRKNITGMINLVLFKLTAAFIVIEGIIAPIAERIGEVFGKIVKSLMAFVTTFLKAIDWKKFGGLLNEIGKSILNITEALFGNERQWSTFGKFLAEIVNPILEGTLILLKGILKVMEGIAEANIKKVFQGIGLDKLKTKEGMGQGFADALRAMGYPTFFIPKKFKGEGETVQDAIIKPDGKVIHTSPGDTLIATRGGMGGEININLGGVNVTTTEGDAVNAGLGVGDGIYRSIRLHLMNDMAASGERA